ncbi:hypothetical protein [Virgibacillus doumboii]|uniref:hypothetical protein n=1 Tax=Virgibacillus doumboii TaxID=2697503 RepID=UPI0013DEC1B6|nr:hypothetical protein [Virgibacillus doumboii]
MSNQTKDYEEHTDELRNLLDEVQGSSEKPLPEENDDKEETNDTDEREVDILNLPPRKEVHNSDNGRVHFKFSGALLRLIFVIVIIVLVVGGSYILLGDELIEIYNSF